jgi:DNA processing protein
MAATQPLGNRSGALSADEKTVLELLDLTETSMDEIVGKSGLPTSNVSSTLLALEMKRLVKKLPGQLFVKLS